MDLQQDTIVINDTAQVSMSISMDTNEVLTCWTKILLNRLSTSAHVIRFRIVDYHPSRKNHEKG